MALCECASANLISKAIFNLIDRTDVLICLHIMFQISFQTSKGQKSYRKFLGVRSELLLSIYVFGITNHQNTFIFFSIIIRFFRHTSWSHETEITSKDLLF